MLNVYIDFFSHTYKKCIEKYKVYVKNVNEEFGKNVGQVFKKLLIKHFKILNSGRSCTPSIPLYKATNSNFKYQGKI